MRIKDIMQKKFVAFQADDRVDRVLEIFSEKDISSAPVFDKDEFLGVVTFSDVARYFAPRSSLPFMGGSEVTMEANAAKLAKKPQLILTPDQPVILALQKMADMDGCVPVMNEKTVIGVVRKSDIVGFFLSERAKEEIERKSKAYTDKKHVSEIENSTAIDKLLEIVRRDGKTTSKKAAKELQISEKTIEDLAKLLDKHHLVQLNYSFISGLVIQRMEHGD